MEKLVLTTNVHGLGKAGIDVAFFASVYPDKKLDTYN